MTDFRPSKYIPIQNKSNTGNRMCQLLVAMILKHDMILPLPNVKGNKGKM